MERNKGEFQKHMGLGEVPSMSCGHVAVNNALDRSSCSKAGGPKSERIRATKKALDPKSQSGGPYLQVGGKRRRYGEVTDWVNPGGRGEAPFLRNEEQSGRKRAKAVEKKSGDEDLI